MPETLTFNQNLQTVRINQMNVHLHELMKELAHRKRCHIAIVYEQAIEHFLKRPENYMGQNKKVR